MIHREDYKGYTIEIHRDTGAEGPESWEDDCVFLTTTRNRYFEVRRQGCNPEDAENPHHYRYPLYAYCHSGVVLGLAPFACPWDSWQIGVVYIAKEEVDNKAHGKALAAQCVEAWNQYLSGEIYGYTITNGDDEGLVDSCWGFYGPWDNVEYGALQQAKAFIDAEGV